MEILNNKIKIHIKNNRWKKGSFPNTSEGEKVFTITKERVDKALLKYPNCKDSIEIFIDWDEDNFLDSMKTSDILLTWNLPIKNLSQLAPKLKWIHCIGAGVEHLLPFDWLTDNILLTNNKGIHSKKAGEYGLMTILMIHNNFPKLITNQKNQLYKSIYGTPIAGKNIVILGTGSLGSSVAALLDSFGGNVIGVNRQGNSVKGCSEILTFDHIDTVLPRADILYIALPETPETINIIDARRLDMLKKSCGIINVGRQSAIDYETLIKKLKDKTLAGAILDVFTPEPIAVDNCLWNVPNLIITPHISADDGENYVSNTLEFFFQNLQNFLSKKSLINLVNKELGY